MPAELDIAAFRSWIGRTKISRATIAADVVERFYATFDIPTPPGEGDIVPPGLHWCLAPDIAASAQLGPDGHPARGLHLPPIPLPRRMWAAGTLAFADPLRVGGTVERHSTIVDIVAKAGRTGPLCFVTIEHQFDTDRGAAIKERQTIVYRGPSQETLRPADTASATTGQWRRIVPMEPVRLFRYSALTFNAHRIHHDFRYATDVEGHPGLVVHGPLQATLLLQFTAEKRSARPLTFEFRAIGPLIAGGPVTLNAEPADDGMALWAASASGTTTTRAHATW